MIVKTSMYPLYFVSACGDGFYGEDCKDMCGHCHNKTACDTVTGKCLIGCEDGFHGLQCKYPC